MTRILLARARAVLATAQEDPAPALEEATAVIEAATDIEELATAHFACGLAHRTLANGADSTGHLEQAAQLAPDGSQLLGRVLRSLAFNYAQAGDHSRGDRTIKRSIGLLSGREADLSRLQQAFMLIMRGEHRAALPVLTTAVGGFTKDNAEDYLELTLYNRALVHVAFGDYDTAGADLERAYGIGIRLNHHVSAADAALHLSQVLGWQDDVPGAMRWHARSVGLRRTAGASNPLADAEHAYVLVQARLMREAESILEDAIPRLVEAGGNEAILVAGRLLLIDVLLARDEHRRALHHAELAASETPVDGRWRFEVAAAHHRIRLAAGEASVDLLRSMQSTAEQMTANGELYSAAMERFRAVELAVSLVDLPTARGLLALAGRYSRAGPLWLQIQAWTAIAQVRLADDDGRGAAAAVRAGMNRLDAYRGGIGATDLRMHAAGLGDKLARIGVRLAIESRSRKRLYVWLERLRSPAGTTRLAQDPELETTLADLRRAAAEARRAGPEDLQPARRRLASLEAKVRQISRAAAGDGPAVSTTPLRTLQRQLTNRTLIEFVEDGPALYAMAITSGRTRLIELGESTDIVGLIDHLRFSAERIARPSTSAASRRAALASAEQSCHSLRQRLLDPVEISTERAVVVPSGALHGVPWGMLVDVPIVTAPSATVWSQALHRRLAPETQPLVVAGPGLAHAAEEAAEIAGMIGAARTSSVAETINRLAGASLVHFACHARPRADSPLFSSLVLEDGELTLYDIERLPSAPATVVLAACSGAGSVLATGTEVLSLAGSFLSMGTRTVIAPLFSVSDEVTNMVMSSVHRSLAAGVDPSAALLEAADSDDRSVNFTARSFICVGAA